jgi:hypothetical protein
LILLWIIAPVSASFTWPTFSRTPMSAESPVTVRDRHAPALEAPEGKDASEALGLAQAGGINKRPVVSRLFLANSVYNHHVDQAQAAGFGLQPCLFGTVAERGHSGIRHSGLPLQPTRRSDRSVEPVRRPHLFIECGQAFAMNHPCRRE